jgi:hypothetical protein
LRFKDKRPGRYRASPRPRLAKFYLELVPTSQNRPIDLIDIFESLRVVGGCPIRQFTYSKEYALLEN